MTGKGEADITKQFDRLTKMKEDSKMECVCKPMPSTGLYSRPAQMQPSANAMFARSGKV
jgi:hypothetical protein